MKKIKKYGNGSVVTNYVENPYEALQQNKIDIQKSKIDANTPLTMGMDILSQMIMGNADTIGKMFGNGGVASSKVNVEGEEVIETPSKQLSKVKGPSHENGGIDLVLPDGSRVYSDRIKIEGKTMQERKLAREKQKSKLKTLAEKTSGDILIKNANSRMLPLIEEEEKKDMMIQQLVDLLSKGNPIPKMATGGFVGDPPPEIDPEEMVEFLKNWSEPDRAKGLIGIEDFSTVNSPNVRMVEKDPEFNPIIEPSSPELVLSSNPDLNAEGLLPETVQANATKNVLGSNINPGDILGLAGNAISTVSGIVNTQRNRATDTPNINYYENFGDEGLKTIEDAFDFNTGVRDEKLQDLELSRNASIKRVNNGARSINTSRAMSLGVDQQVNEQQSDIYEQFANQTMNLLMTKANVLNTKDQVVMQGESARDLADRQDNDNYYTQRGLDFQSIGTGLQATGKDVNAMKQQQMIQNLLNQLSSYGFKMDNDGNITMDK